MDRQAPNWLPPDPVTAGLTRLRIRVSWRGRSRPADGCADCQAYWPRPARPV